MYDLIFQLTLIVCAGNLQCRDLYLNYSIIHRVKKSHRIHIQHYFFAHPNIECRKYKMPGPLPLLHDEICI